VRNETPARSPYLTTVAPMARKNKIEKNAPSILSNVNIPFIKGLGNPGISGTSGGSIKSFVPENYKEKKGRSLH
jgi:hypothetical protein